MRNAPALVAALRDVYGSVDSLVATLDDADWSRPTGCPGWTVKDNLSHIVGLEAELLGRVRAAVEVPAHPHIRDDMGVFMEQDVELRRSRTPAEVVAEYREVIPRRVEALAALDAGTDLKADVEIFMGRTAPLGRFLGIRIFDTYAHEQDMRRATGRPGHQSGPAAELSRDRILGGLSMALASVAPPGTTMTVETTGGTAATHTVTIGGDAAGVRVGDGGALHLTMPFETLIALGCGRADADRSQVAVRGDAALAAALLDGFGVTP